MIIYLTKDNLKEHEQKIYNWLYIHTEVGLDTETTGLDPLQDRILLIQFGDSSTQYVLNCVSIPHETIVTILKHLTTDNHVQVGHNIKFDYKMIKTNFNISLTNPWCTMVMHQLSTSGLMVNEHNLQAVVKRKFKKELNKTIRTNFLKKEKNYEFTEEEINYSAEDIRYLLPLKKVIEADLATLGIPQELINLECMTTVVTAEMELAGIHIDKNLWLNLENIAKNDALVQKQKLFSYFDSSFQRDILGEVDINFNSPVQVIPAFNKLTGLKLTSLDAKILEQYKIEYPIIDDYLKYKKATKLISTYGKEFLEKNVSKIDSRIHASFMQMGTVTGRFSCSNPNLQNIPKSQTYRDPFCVSNDDYKIISADFSGQELRLLVQLSKEPELIRAIKDGLDLHSYSASLLFGINYNDFLVFDETGKQLFDEDGEPIIKSEMKKNYRNPCKQITFGLLYGAGPSKLAQQLGVPYEKAKELIDLYFKTFPNVKKLMDSLSTTAEDTKIATSPLDGKKRYLYVDWGNIGSKAHALNQAKNFPFQGCGASITKLAMCKIYLKFKKENLDAKIILQVHDELLVESHINCIERATQIVKTGMIAAFNYFAPDIPMAVSPKIGKKWIH